ncbi:MAG TPA: glycosyltransferase family 1 protein [Burkholderiales bacterium]
MHQLDEKLARRAEEERPHRPAPAERSGRLHIALVTETYPPELNGVSLSVRRIVDYLRERGHAVEVVRPRQPADHAGSAGDEEFLLRGMTLPLYPGLRFGFPATRHLRTRWLRQRPDVVHVATEGPLGWSALRAASSLRIPVTADYRTHFQRYSGHYGVGWLSRPIDAYLRRFHNRAHMTFVATAALQRELASRGFENVAQVGRGIDTQLFNPNRRRAELRQRWGLREGELALIYVGRLAPEKNLDLALRAYERVRQVRRDARMVWVGDGPGTRRLQRTHPDHIYAGLQQGVDLASHYASADLFLFPSMTETFGNVTLEALSSGLAVVAFNEAAAAQHGRDRLSARLVPSGDEVAFINAAVEVACVPELLARLRANAPRAVAAVSWPSVLSVLESHLLASAHRYRLYANTAAAN